MMSRRSNSLYRLSQQDIEDLILNEHTTPSTSTQQQQTVGSELTAPPEHDLPPGSSLSESLAQDWDLEVSALIRPHHSF